MSRTKLAIISTHPIQYQAPIFRSLAQSAAIHARVFYTWPQAVDGAVLDPGFGTSIRWDVPLLEGYEYELVPNVSPRPGSSRFFGIDNPHLARMIEAWGAEAILVIGWNLYSHLRALLRFKGRAAVFFRGDSTLLDERPLLQRMLRRRILTWVYRHIDVALAVGRNNSAYFARHGVPPERISVVPHSIDTRRFAGDAQVNEAKATAWRAELGVGADERVLLYAGKLIPTKNVLFLLEAFLRSNASGRLVFCGNGILEDDLRRRAAGHARVHFLPFQNQSVMPLVYRLADVFILPSRGETWGLALNEAMACGRAVIASSRVGGAVDLIEHGRNGWIFESDDLADLTALLRSVDATDRSVLREMGAHGGRMALAWSSEETARRIEAVVTDFLRNRRATDTRLRHAVGISGVES